MNKTRLEAFSDGVIAIIITIMVLELKVPHGEQWSDLASLLPVFLSYVLSFINVGIYWGNHHHLLHMLKRVSAGVMWANLHLMFWLSLLPFATAWMGENHFANVPTFVYCGVLFMTSWAYSVLIFAIRRANNETRLLPNTHAYLHKGNFSLLLHLVAVGLSFWQPAASQACIVMVALMWLIPDRRIEQALNNLNLSSHSDH